MLTVKRVKTNNCYRQWEAQDPSGNVYQYAHKPKRTPHGWFEKRSGGLKVGNFSCTSQSWKKSLVKIIYEG